MTAVSNGSGPGTVDMKLEVAVIPVPDVDRANASMKIWVGGNDREVGSAANSMHGYFKGLLVGYALDQVGSARLSASNRP